MDSLTEKTTDTKQAAADKFNSQDMISFGNFIRDNYYVAGSPKLLSYYPQKYPNANIDEIFVYWAIENGK